MYATGLHAATAIGIPPGQAPDRARDLRSCAMGSSSKLPRAAPAGGEARGGDPREAYDHGVSTRLVDDLVKDIGAGGRMSKSQVSRLCAGIDDG